MNQRLRFLPLALALGLFVGDLLTLLITGDLALGRLAVSGLVSIAAYVAARWAIQRRS